MSKKATNPLESEALKQLVKSTADTIREFADNSGLELWQIWEELGAELEIQDDFDD